MNLLFQLLNFKFIKIHTKTFTFTKNQIILTSCQNNCSMRKINPNLFPSRKVKLLGVALEQ